MAPPTHYVSQLDLTQLGIVSVLRSLPDDAKDWEEVYRIGQVEYRVSGQAPLGRPFGVDADILLAVQTLFARGDFPGDNFVDTSAYGLLSLAGHHVTGDTYTRLRESLLRLKAVQWTYSRYVWRDDNRVAVGGTVATGLFAQVELPERLQAGTHAAELTTDARVRIYLTPAFAQSIRAGLYQLLDGALLDRLEQPAARSLYRVLQAHRVQPDGSLAGTLRVSLRDWLRACGIVGRIDSAKDTLARAHDALQAAGYLESVESEGRGQQAVLTYHFARPHADPELVELLVKWGVGRPGAQALAADYPDRVRPAVAEIEARIAEGFKPRSLGAVVTDAVRNPGKYPGAPADKPSKAPRSARKAPAAREMDVAPHDRHEALASAFRIAMRREMNLYEHEVLTHLGDDGLNALSAALRDGNKDLALSILQ
ncbi:replication initiator protein A [Deinococcus sp. PEB2-63]